MSRFPTSPSRTSTSNSSKRPPPRPRCPHKGTAGYWRVTAVGEAAEDFMWSYETPFERARAIAGHGAFDKRRARIEMVRPGRLGEATIL